MYRGMASIDSSDSIDSMESSDLPDDIDEDCWPPVEDSDDDSLPGDIDDDGLPDDVHNDDLADQLIGSDGGGNLMDTDESHDVVEVFSLPRLVPVGRESGLVCEWSFDLETGHDLTFEKHRRFMWETIQKVKPRVAVVSPPCTFYSAANRVWDKNRYSVEETDTVLRNGNDAMLLRMFCWPWQCKFASTNTTIKLASSLSIRRERRHGANPMLNLFGNSQMSGKLFSMLVLSAL